MRWAVLVLAAVGVMGCGDGDAPAAVGPTARFELGDGVPAFGDVPFPSELYRDDDGRIALGGFPNPQWEGPMFGAVAALLAERDGFCTSCTIRFGIEGDVAVPAAPAGWDDGVALVDVDPDSPEHGTSIPLRVQHDAERGLLSIRPARGYTLGAARRYAAVLTRDLTDAQGHALAPAASFARVRDGAARDGREADAAERLAPALDALEALGLARDRIAAIAAFTTGDPSREVLALRAQVVAGAPPVASVDDVLEGARLDEVLGVPLDAGPGIDLAPAGEGSAAIAHDTTALVVVGRFAAPRFVEGSGADIGALRRDAQGLPVSEANEDVPFILIVPAGADPAQLPVVITQHGFSASRTTGFAIGDTAGRAGYAVLAIDGFQHGARAAAARDEYHALRGDVPGADGFAETTPLEVSSRMFGLSGAADGMTLFPGYAQAAFAQLAADVMSAVRLVKEGDIAAIRAAHPALAELAFDPARIAFVGNSMGAVVGTAVLVAEPDVRAAVLDVMPGSISETLCESGEFRGLSSSLLLPQVGVTDTFDEVARAMIFDPTVDLFRWVLEPVDPLALARYLARERRPAAGALPHVLIQLAGHDEVAAPTASESVVAAAGIAGSGDFAFAEVAPVALPLSDADASVAAVRFDGAMHGMLEVHRQDSRYLAPLEPPLEKRDAPLAIDNPIDAVHLQIETFLRSFAEEGRATIIAP